MLNKFAQIGPRSIPTVPIQKFTKIRNAEIHKQIEELWSIIGPSAELNLARLPLWKVITMAYIEGVMHGSQMKEEQNDDAV